MLTPPKFLHPPSLADRLFFRITAIYGSQKTASMWAGLCASDATEAERAAAFEEVKSVWADALTNYHIDVIFAAVRSLATSAQSWPPSLPEFCALCRAEEERLKPQAANLLRIGDDTGVADPDSPAVQAFRAEMAKFLRRHA